MKSLHYVIVKADSTYVNQEDVDGIEYTVNVDIDNVKSINRTAEVVCAPDGSNLSSGDTVVIHHNIMRENIHTSGKKTRGNYYIADNHWWCPMSEVIMKKDKRNKWVPLENFLFVRPIKQEDIELSFGITLKPRSYKGMQEKKGIIVIGNDKLTGACVGDTVYLTDHSEHEFIIDGELLYKCEIEDILGKE